jgi:CII-binding regulator of phage lambda lysogenization HflD
MFVCVFSTLYEEEEQESFHESLGVRIKGHEKDIERMCNKNYQGFIESVSELLKVKSDAVKLKRKVQEVNHTIQDTGQQLMQSAAELHHARHVQKNVLSTVEALGLCVPALLQAERANGRKAILLCTKDFGTAGAHISASSEGVHFL